MRTGLGVLIEHPGGFGLGFVVGSLARSAAVCRKSFFSVLYLYKEGFGFAFCGGRQCRTRRLILVGSYLEHIAQNDPEREARLMKGLDGFLERDRDRELFGVPPHPGSAGAF